MKNKISDYCRQIRGVSYKPSDVFDELTDDSITLLRANNIVDGKIILDDVLYISRKKVSQDQIMQPGDILICASSGSKKLVGKAAQFDGSIECTFGAFCKIVRPKENIDSDYLGIYFQSKVYRDEIARLSQGANINNIRNEHVDNLSFSPPIQEEQHKRKIKAQLLVSIIEKRKREREALDKLIKARFVEMFGKNVFNREQLKNNVQEMFIGPFGSSLKNDSFVDKNNGYCVVYEQKHAIKKSIKMSFRYVTKEKYEELKRWTILPGDIIVSCRGTIGEIYEIPKNAPMGIMHPSIMKIRLNETYDHQFFVSMLQQYMEEEKVRSVGSSVKMAITASSLGKKEFIVPPISTQHEYSSFVQQIDKSKVVIQKSIDKTQMLFDSLMQEYFS